MLLRMNYLCICCSMFSSIVSNLVDEFTRVLVLEWSLLKPHSALPGVDRRLTCFSLSFLFVKKN